MFTRDRQRGIIASDRLLQGARPDVGFSDLLQDYRATPDGIHHSHQPQRFSKWPYAHAVKLLDLGRRVDPVGHGDAVGDRVATTLGSLAASSRAFWT
jgi:hypothetical protein